MKILALGRAQKNTEKQKKNPLSDIYKNTFDLSDWRGKQLKFSIENTLTIFGIFLLIIFRLKLELCFEWFLKVNSEKINLSNVHKYG